MSTKLPEGVRINGNVTDESSEPFTTYGDKVDTFLKEPMSTECIGDCLTKRRVESLEDPLNGDPDNRLEF
jgi:hypothetical protein